MAFAKDAGEKIVLNDDLDRAYKEVEEWVVDGGKLFEGAGGVGGGEGGEEILGEGTSKGARGS